jgi:hypothetical protein
MSGLDYGDTILHLLKFGFENEAAASADCEETRHTGRHATHAIISDSPSHQAWHPIAVVGHGTVQLLV